MGFRHTPADVIATILERIRKGASAREVADDLNLNPDLVRRICKRNGVVLSEIESEKRAALRQAARAMLAKGYTDKAVEQALKLHWRTVAELRRSMGLETTKRKRKTRTPSVRKVVVEVPRWVHPENREDYIWAARAQDEFAAAKWARQQQAQTQAA